MTQPAISFHLRRLRQAGIVRARVDGKHRFYALDRSELEGMEAWLHRNRTFWNERFDAMENDLTRSTTKRRREK